MGLSRITVLLPSLPEQRRIAAILDKADSVRQKRDQALVMADGFLKAAFLERFGDPQANRLGLPKAPIKELGTVITGNTPPRSNPKNYGHTIEWIKSDNINTPEHILTRADEYLSELGKSIGRIAPAGSTLVTCIAGSPGVIGNAALADREVAFNQQINAVVPHRETDSYFLYCQFLVGKTLVQTHSTNSMKGMVSKGKFQEIRFLKPGRDEQREFGRIFERALSSRDRIRDDLIDSHTLFASLSARAFRGEL
jgi:type I restriction enzyme S subunit